MEKKDYSMVVLSTVLLVSLGLNVMPEPTHYCDSRELKAYCFSLSETLKTCYTLPNNKGGKRCSEGWKELIIAPEGVETVQVDANGKIWECEIKEGKINKYSNCFSGKYHGYLGEFI